MPNDTTVALVLVALILWVLLSAWRGVHHRPRSPLGYYVETCRACHEPLDEFTGHLTHPGVCCACHHGGDLKGAA